MITLIPWLLTDPVPVDPATIYSWVNTSVLATAFVLFVFGIIVPVKFLTSAEVRNTTLQEKNDQLRQQLSDSLDVNRQQALTIAKLSDASALQSTTLMQLKDTVVSLQYELQGRRPGASGR
jgi:uncharacterized protein HemX